MYRKYEILLIYMSCTSVKEVMDVSAAFKELMELARDFSHVSIIQKLALRRIMILQTNIGG